MRDFLETFLVSLPALPRKCSDSRVGASSPGKCRSPQTAPRLWRPYLGSIEPSRSPEVMLDAFRASLTGPESCLLQLRPCMHKFQRAQIGRSVMPQRLGCRAGIIYDRPALLAAPRIVMGRLCNLLQLTPSEWVRSRGVKFDLQALRKRQRDRVISMTRMTTVPALRKPAGQPSTRTSYPMLLQRLRSSASTWR